MPMEIPSSQKRIYGVKSIPNYILYLKEYKILPLHQRQVYNR